MTDTKLNNLGRPRTNEPGEIHVLCVRIPTTLYKRIQRRAAETQLETVSEYIRKVAEADLGEPAEPVANILCSPMVPEPLTSEPLIPATVPRNYCPPECNCTHPSVRRMGTICGQCKHDVGVRLI